MDLKPIFIILVSYFLPQTVYAKFDSNKFEREMNAVRKVLKYIAERPEQMNIDAIAGVTLAEAFIEATLQHKNTMFLDTYQKNSLVDIFKLAESTRMELLANENFKQLAGLGSVINQPEIWKRPIIWRKVNPNRKVVVSPSRDVDASTSEISKSLFHGHPQEEESDYCLLNLAQDCEFPLECQDAVLGNDNSTGYPLAHKLFLMQSMIAFGCEIKIVKFFPYLSNKFCSLMLQELIDFEIMSFPSITKDLAAEQICLCGMEGYLDFLSDHYEQLILDWQHPSGCYSGQSGKTSAYSDSRRFRRSAEPTDFGCTNHATGIGAAVLALMIRKNLELIMDY